MLFITHEAAALTGCHSKQAIPELLGRTLEVCAKNTDDWQLSPGSPLAPAVKQTLQPLWALPKICTNSVVTALYCMISIVTALIIDN